MLRYRDHRFVGLLLRQGAGIDVIDFKKIQGSLHCRPFVAVEICLTLSKMVRVRGRDFVEITVAVKMHIQGLGYCRFQPAFAANTV